MSLARATDVAVRPFYLFLDFDGVLHPTNADIMGFFVHADRLGQLLDLSPEVQVIVSSSWRETYPIGTLQEFCGPILGSRLIGVTPVHRRQREFVDAKPRLRLRADGHAPIARLRFRSNDEPFHERFEEIALWLAVHASPSLNGQTAAESASSRDDWIALDDNAAWFPAGCRQLLHVDGGQGLTAADLAVLEVRLANHLPVIEPTS